MPAAAAFHLEVVIGIVLYVDAGSRNGCELEIHMCNNPYYNLEGLGIRFVY